MCVVTYVCVCVCVCLCLLVRVFKTYLIDWLISILCAWAQETQNNARGISLQRFSAQLYASRTAKHTSHNSGGWKWSDIHDPHAASPYNRVPVRPSFGECVRTQNPTGCCRTGRSIPGEDIFTLIHQQPHTVTEDRSTQGTKSGQTGDWWTRETLLCSLLIDLY